MRLEQLYLLILIDRYETLSAVAKKLHMAQSTLSYNIKALEEELGVEIFRKEGGRLVFTAIGKEILCRAEKIEKAQKKIENIAKMQASIGQLSGELNIGYGSQLSGAVLVNALIALKKRYPFCYISMYLKGNHEILNDIIQNKFDGGIVQIDCIDEADSLSLMVKNNLSRELLFYEDLGFVVKKTHPLFKQDVINLADVMKYPFVTSKKNSMDLYLRFLRRHGSEQNCLFVPDYVSQHTLLEKFEYVTMMPHRIFHKMVDTYHYELQEIYLEDFSCKSTFWWTYNEKAQTEINRRLLAILYEAMKEGLGIGGQDENNAISIIDSY